jgi:hypothetical protein
MTTSVPDSISSPSTTLAGFDAIMAQCKMIYEIKNRDYGPSWTILRRTSLTDQIYIKALRIRTIEELHTQKVSDSIQSEFIGIINYCIMALMLPANNTLAQWGTWDNSSAALFQRYENEVMIIRQLLEIKNHDYGEAWRHMRATSFTDMILTKLLRIKQIEDNQGQTVASEGVESGFRDIVNYAVFSLMTLELKIQS